MKNRDEYIEKMKAQLEQWEKQMAIWEAAALEATADARIELEKQMASRAAAWTTWSIAWSC